MILSVLELTLILDALDLLEADFTIEYPNGHPDQLVLDALTVKLRKEHRAAKADT